MGLMTTRHKTLAGLAILAVAITRPAVAGGDFASTEYGKLNLTKDPSAAAPGLYSLDPKHTSVTVRLAHEDLSHYTLRFDTVKGQFTFDPVHPASSPIQVVIDPNSVDTGNPAFNKTIAAQYFEAAKYPSITFTSTAITVTGDHGVIDGVLDFHGVKKPIKLNLTFNGYTNLDGQPRMGFSGEATFRRSDFGVGAWIPLEGDAVNILIESEFSKAK
jgi:polyisoprenoid-binding protein YceI